MRDGLGEVVVPAAPLVDGLRTGRAETVGDLCRTDEVVGVDAAAHLIDGRDVSGADEGFCVYGRIRRGAHASRVRPYTFQGKEAHMATMNSAAAVIELYADGDVDEEPLDSAYLDMLDRFDRRDRFEVELAVGAITASRANRRAWPEAARIIGDLVERADRRERMCGES